MLPLILGLLLFFAVHLVPTSPSLRAGLVERFGEPAYKIGFAVLSLIGFVLIVVGYHKLQVMPGKNPVLWDPPTWTRHIAFLLMVPAMILLVAAFVPSRIRTAAKHPMLAAIKFSARWCCSAASWPSPSTTASRSSAALRRFRPRSRLASSTTCSSSPAVSRCSRSC
jgi:uncharacterized membrane protein